MKIFKFSKAVAVILLLTMAGFVQTYGQVESVSLEDAINTALRNNSDIKISLLDVDKSEEAVDEAIGYALPSLDLNAQFTHLIEKPKTPFPDFESMLTASTYGVLFDENIIPYDASKLPDVSTKLQSFAQANTYEASLQLSQILFNSAVFRGIGASEIYLQLAKESLKQQVGNVILSVKTAYYGALLAKESKEITEASLSNAEDNLSNVKALNEAGLASDFEYLQVQVQVENIRPQVKQLQNMYEDAKNGLKVLMGVPVEKDIELEGRIEFDPVFAENMEQLVNEAMLANPDLQVLQTKRIVDDEMIAIDRADYWPTIAAFGSVGYSGSADDMDFQSYRTTAVGLSFTMNLFQGGRVASKVQQSKISLMQTDTQLSNMKEYLKTQVESKVRELRKVEEEINALEKNVELAQRAYEIAETRYSEGTGTQLEIKNADIELRTAKTNRLESVHRYIVAASELSNVLGRINDAYVEFVLKNENK